MSADGCSRGKIASISLVSLDFSPIRSMIKRCIGSDNLCNPFLYRWRYGSTGWQAATDDQNATGSRNESEEREKRKEKKHKKHEKDADQERKKKKKEKKKKRSKEDKDIWIVAAYYCFFPLFNYYISSQNYLPINWHVNIICMDGNGKNYFIFQQASYQFRFLEQPRACKTACSF